MFTLLKNFFLGKEEDDDPPVDIVDRINFNLRKLTDEIIKTYSVRKAMTVKVSMSSQGPRSLSNWLSDASRIVDTQEYVPDVWKTILRVEVTFILDDYMTHNGYVIDIDQWLSLNKPKIVRLVTALKRLDWNERDYYQRNYNSVLRDIDSLLTGVVASCK